MKNRAFLVSILGIILINSCTIGFDIDSDPITIDVPNTLGAYLEQAIDVPPELHDSRATFTEVTVMYNVTKSDALSADVSIYVSPLQASSLLPGPGHEKIVDVSLIWSSSTLSGETVSTNIEYDLNHGYEQIYIGVKNMSVGLFNPVSVVMTIHFKGEYKLF